MIVFDRLWETMGRRGVGEEMLLAAGLPRRHLQALHANDSRVVSTGDIDLLCRVLGCSPEDVMESRW